MAFDNEQIQITVTEDSHGFLAGDRDLRFLYVYEGKARLVINQIPVYLQKDDFFAVNSGDAAEYFMESPGFAGVLRLKYALAADYLELRKYYIVCSSLKEYGGSEERIGVYLRSMFSHKMSKDPSRDALLLADAYNLLYLLYENCRVRRKTELDLMHEDENRRIERIRTFLTENFMERITLEDLSRETFFSIAYLSKYIKRNFGRNFSEVLLDLRLSHAEADLIHTDMSITSIAMDNGFASPVAFTRFFRDKHGITPSEYRQQMQKEQKPEDDTMTGNSEPNSRLARMVQERSRGEELYEVNARTLKAKVSEARRYKRFWAEMINGGTAHDLMRADLQEHLLTLHRKLGIQYVRFWDLHSPEMMLVDMREGRRYNFVRLDSVTDFLVKNQMHPYIELGPKPNVLLKNTHEYLIAERRNRIADTVEEYGEFVEQLARHFVRRYGLEEVSKWYFELWLETYSSDLEEYIHVFEVIQNSLKRVSGDLRLGGPGISSETRIPIDQVVKAWAEREQKPDFISYYIYPYSFIKQPAAYEERTPENAGRVLAENFADHMAKDISAMLRENGFWNQEKHVSEWNSTVANRNTVNDSIYKGAYVVRNLLAMMGEVDLAGYWFASDLFTEFYDTEHLMNGSGGLITKDGICKPAYYGLSFMNRLEPYLLSGNQDGIITANTNNSYSIVCHNYRHPEYPYFMTDEDVIRIQDYGHYFDKEKRDFHFIIEGVKNGIYQIKTRQIDANHGSVQDEWVRMGLTDNLNEQDIEYLRRICVPYITIETLEVTDGVLDIHSILEPNAIENIHIYLLE